MTDGVDRTQNLAARGSTAPNFSATEILDRMRGEIGRGSFGIVYSLDGFPDLAVKEIRIDGQNSDVVRSVRFEISVILEMSHPGILKYYQAIEDSDFIYIVMDRHHENLDSFLIKSKRRKLYPSVEEIFSIIGQIAAALDYLCSFSHKDADGNVVNGVVHRDIKPTNVLVSENGKRVALADFGLCKSSARSGSTFAGTKSYMAPESLIHKKTSIASDIWGLGVIIYEVATMKKLNFLNGKSPEDVFVAGWRPDLSAVTDDFIRAILEKIFVLDPKERPTARDLVSLFKLTEVSTKDLGIQVRMLKFTLSNANVRISSLESESKAKTNEIVALRRDLEKSNAKINELEQKFEATINDLKSQVQRAIESSSASSTTKKSPRSSSKGGDLLGKLLRSTIGDSSDGVDGLLTALAIKKIHDGIMESDDSSSDKGITDLMRAADRGDVEAVKRLIPEQKGQQTAGTVSVRGLSLEGRTALMGAAARGHTEVVRLLVDHEGGMTDRRGWSALMIASRNDHPGCVELLLQKEAGMQMNDGETALMLAARNNNLGCIKLLLEKEARLQMDDGDTALILAVHRNNARAVRLLLEKEVRMQNEHGWTALMVAALRDRPRCVELLVEMEAGMQKDDGYTALMLAANNDHKECVKLLIDKEKDFVNKKGETALDIAINNGYEEITAMLLE